ncbi:CynX/NimT family MFS transporter [Bacillus dakarensis]|uniref:CynX/NimT family MFS transporter n=1 Tax=Robertmurraya dakarensis TaxID=1926278 RepID=UPI000981FAD7|nr:MFS transporter [Bacillus dakarensis]
MKKPSLYSFGLETVNTRFLLIGIIFVAFNLRPAITSVGPLLTFIRDDIGISNTLAGFITTLPLIAFAILSPIAPKIAHKIGKERTVFIALLILGLGIFIRSTEMIFLLFFGTAFIGVGIALCNVLLPGIVKENFPKKVGLMTGFYTVAMALWAGIAPGISVPLSENLKLGWQKSLTVWLILVIIAIVVWLPQLKRNSKSTKATVNILRPKSSLLQSPIAWQVSIFMGLQSCIYFCSITWLPDMLYSHGVSVSTAGWMVSLLQFSGLPANFLVPVLADKLPNQKGLSILIGAFCMTGLSGLLLSGNLLVLTLCIIMLGSSTGAAISLALTLIGLRAANAEQAANLSGMSQSIGYLLAAIGPFSLGFLFDLYHTWTLPIILLIILTVIMTIAGVGAGRSQYVSQEPIRSSQLNY